MPRHAEGGELGRQHRLLPAGRHERHGGEVVDLVGTDLAEDSGQRGLVEQVGLEQLDLAAQVFDA